MQVAGENRLLTEEPGKLMDSGNYTTDVQIMFGANQQEGIYVLGGSLWKIIEAFGYLNMLFEWF